MQFSQPATRQGKPMRRHLWILFGLALAFRLALATFITQPGYMDTAYYAAQAVRLAEGAGASEPYLWNYLNQPAGIPNPAFGYWMPLPSLLAAPFWWLYPSFFALQFPFALLSALVVSFGAYVAWAVSGKLRHLWIAGLLLIFSGTVTAYWTLPETFTPFALFGAVTLWAGARYWQTGRARWLVLGILTAGLAYLTRSDGLLLIGMTLLLPIGRRQWQSWALGTLLTLVVLSPWFLYNLRSHGAPLPVGGVQSLWLTRYDDLFCYGCELTLHQYLAWGWPAILDSKLDALWLNLQIVAANVGYLFLLPFMLIGLWRQRDARLTWPALYLLLLFAAMTFAFTFPGPRGALFHSGVALLPFSIAAGLVGLDHAVAWAGIRRKWRVAQAQMVFSAATVLLAMVISLRAPGKFAEWRQANTLYPPVQQWLLAQAQPPCPVLVGDPPRFWFTTRWPALVIPNEVSTTVAQAAHHYGACWLLLDPNRPAPLADLYTGQSDSHWQLTAQWENGKLYRLVDRQTAEQ